MKKSIFWSLALAATSLVVLGGCQRGVDDAEQTDEVKQVAAPTVNYSLAQPLELTQIKSEKEFLEFCQKNEIAVVKFGADWCGPCKMLIPELQKMAGYFQTENVKIAEVDVEDLPSLSNEMHISGIPATFVYYNGNFYSSVEGNDPQSIASLIDSICQQEVQTASSEAGADSKRAEDAPLTLEEELWSDETNAQDATDAEIEVEETNDVEN